MEITCKASEHWQLELILERQVYILRAKEYVYKSEHTALQCHGQEIQVEVQRYSISV